MNMCPRESQLTPFVMNPSDVASIEVTIGSFIVSFGAFLLIGFM